nr:MAG TPA: hypothetical protein [Caudoviricetes sp.]
MTTKGLFLLVCFQGLKSLLHNGIISSCQRDFFVSKI